MSANLYRYLFFDTGTLRKDILDTMQVQLLANGWELINDQCTLDAVSWAVQLTAGINNTVTTIPVNDTTGFPDRGIIHIGSERIRYLSKTPTSFTSCTRGVFRTSAASHLSGVNVMPGFFRVYKTIRDSKPAYPGGPTYTHYNEGFCFIAINTAGTQMQLAQITGWDNNNITYPTQQLGTWFNPPSVNYIDKGNIAIDLVNGFYLWQYCGKDFLVIRTKTTGGNSGLESHFHIQQIAPPFTMGHADMYFNTLYMSVTDRGIFPKSFVSDICYCRYFPTYSKVLSLADNVLYAYDSFGVNVATYGRAIYGFGEWRHASGGTLLGCRYYQLGGINGLNSIHIRSPHLSAAYPDESEGAFNHMDYEPTTLTASMGTGDTTAHVASTANFLDNGRIIINAEAMNYYGKTATTLTNLERGRFNSAITTHGNGSSVYRARRGKIHTAWTPRFVMFMEE